MLKAEITSTGEEDTDLPILGSPNRSRNTVEIGADGSLVVTSARKKSSIPNIFRRKNSTKVILDDNRVPFMALYQVR